jgi:hypothetical protein
MNRFDLEQAIYDADMSTELKTAFERHCDGPVMSQDQRDNMLMALWQIAELKHWKLMDTFCRMYELNEYCQDPEVLARRESFDRANGRIKEDVE